MSLLLQQLLVAVLVVASALFSAWRLASVRLRLRALDAVQKLPVLHALPGLARLRERTLARQLSACGGCAQAGHAAKSRPP
jgi:CBS domain containing-hemolysin-like protein